MSNHSINSRNPLLIADLFQCVLECLITAPSEHPSKEEQKMLAVLARTCRTFSAPSLNLLWRRLDSLLPLLRCFSDVVDEARAKTFPSPLEWLVINRYVPRIQDITLGTEPLSMFFMKRTDLILPNLRVFRFKRPQRFRLLASDLPSPFVWRLLNPKPVSLEVQFYNPIDPEYNSFLENYPLFCPHLKSIKLGFLDRNTVPQSLSQALCSNANWQHVELSPSIDDAVLLKHLGICSTLKTVSLSFASQTSCFGPEDTPFRGVSDLSLILQNSLDPATCLLRPRDQLFHSFKVTLHTLTVEADVSALLTVLASPQRVYSLQSINISHSHGLTFGPLVVPSIDSLRHRQPLSYETFHPLIPLVHLRQLVINLSHPTSLNDEEFAALVRNWPLLENLQMTWSRGEDRAPSMTLKTLPLLLRHCRKLRHIALTLDARVVPVAGTYADVCNPFITHPIKFHNSPLECPDLVAKFLLKHLPSVPEVSSSFTQLPAFSISTAADSLRDLAYLNAMNQFLWLQVNKCLSQPTFRVFPDQEGDVEAALHGLMKEFLELSIRNFISPSPPPN